VGGAKKKQTVYVPLAACTREWSSRERTIIDLHCFYLGNIWSLNDWKMYYRYKKHLPKESQFEVDRLVDFIVKGFPNEMRATLEAIFAVVWDAEDWLAVLGSDELARDLDVDERNAWREKVAAVMLNLARDGKLYTD
jgi:hypothetical protein